MSMRVCVYNNLCTYVYHTWANTHARAFIPIDLRVDIRRLPKPCSGLEFTGCALKLNPDTEHQQCSRLPEYTSDESQKYSRDINILVGYSKIKHAFCIGIILFSAERS